MLVQVNRQQGFEFLKIVATLFVVILHINGFFIETNPQETLPFCVNLAFHIIEAVAYPAIHLFVMLTSWFAIERDFSTKNILNVCIQTWLICLLGVFAALFLKIPFELKELFRSVFPLIGRAYWYVTDYVLLIFISPVLNIVIRKLSGKELLMLVCGLFLVESVFPLFFYALDWKQDYSNIGLFILLYFMTAVIKNKTIPLKHAISCYIMSVLCLIIFWLILYALGTTKNPVYYENQMIFYQYCSPLVIFEAAGLIAIFSKLHIDKINEKIRTLIRTTANASIVTYLIHMHPIFKLRYVEYGLFSWMTTSNIYIYIRDIRACSLHHDSWCTN